MNSVSGIFLAQIWSRSDKTSATDSWVDVMLRRVPMGASGTFSSHGALKTSACGAPGDQRGFAIS